jgi:hypothetical protein
MTLISLKWGLKWIPTYKYIQVRKLYIEEGEKVLDRDGHRNVGTIRTPNAADSPRRLHH